MPRYRSVPTEVDAEQWFPGKDVKGVRVDPLVDLIAGDPRLFHHVVTIHGQKAYLDPGDYVITEHDGFHHYPCKPDIFEKKYRPVEAADEIEASLAECRKWRLTDAEVEELLS